jgi:hypothetical protein
MADVTRIVPPDPEESSGSVIIVFTVEKVHGNVCTLWGGLRFEFIQGV